MGWLNVSLMGMKSVDIVFGCSFGNTVLSTSLMEIDSVSDLDVALRNASLIVID